KKKVIFLALCLPRRAAPELGETEIFFRFRVSRSRAPCSALQRLLTPSHAFPALNVQLAKQLTASGVFWPPRSEARSDARKHAFENTGPNHQVYWAFSFGWHHHCSR
ncbi:unnamed protein product, partial [Prunus brigantina]